MAHHSTTSLIELELNFGNGNRKIELSINIIPEVTFVYSDSIQKTLKGKEWEVNQDYDSDENCIRWGLYKTRDNMNILRKQSEYYFFKKGGPKCLEILDSRTTYYYHTYSESSESDSDSELEYKKENGLYFYSDFETSESDSEYESESDSEYESESDSEYESEGDSESE